MPGVIRLARELGVARNSVETALRQLEKDGLLRSQGQGRGRVIDLKSGSAGASAKRVEILLGERSERRLGYMIELAHALQDAGHIVDIAPKTLDELGDRPTRVARMVEQSKADAWIVYSATREVLRWFAHSPRPAFAVAGRATRQKIPSIAPDKITPMRLAVRRLVELGHRRIVMMVRPVRRIPEPGLFERAFLDELEALGIPTGSYNLPDWEESVEGFHAGLDSLFRLTPPTAAIIDEGPFVTATLQFCMSKGLRVPEDLSILCTDPDPSFDWCQPSIAHIHWDAGPIIRRVVRWANNVSLGREDFRKGYSKARFIDGGTVGPAKR